MIDVPPPCRSAPTSGPGAISCRRWRCGAEIGADVVQVFTQSPRAWKPMQYSDEVLRAYRDAEAVDTRVRQTFCHATYLINLAGADPEVRERSRLCLQANFAVATAMGARGLVLHVGSHRGRGFEASLPQVVDALLGTLAGQPGGECPIVLENAAGTGDTVGRTLDELATILQAAGPDADGRLLVCLDTQHLGRPASTTARWRRRTRWWGASTP